MAAGAEPDRVGITCEGRRWTYDALWRAAQRAALIFRASGCEYVALLDTSSEASAIALFGAAIAGIAYVPLNYRLADTDLAAQIERISPAYIVGDPEMTARLKLGDPHVVTARAAFIEAASSGPDEDVEAIEDGEAVAVQLFTSGTTAAPKAAILRHSNLLSYILGSVEFGAADEAEAALVSVPPYHIAGVAALLSSIYALRRIVLMPNFDPVEWIALSARERVTNAFLVPTMLSRIVTAIDAGHTADFSALRAIAYGGGRMPIELVSRALELFPDTNFTNAYGLTETSSTIALMGPEDHRKAKHSEDPAVRARLGSVGRGLPAVEIEIRGEDGGVLPAGETGEVYVRGPQVSGEYRERSALDAEGWFPTRDAGYLDSEGYLFLAGRADDVIVRGGENISPGEIEDLLLEHPAIADAAAVGIPSIEWGEAVAVALVPREGTAALCEDDVRRIVRERLRSSRVPERILIVDALPYSEMGKLLRREIRSMFARAA